MEWTTPESGEVRSLLVREEPPEWKPSVPPPPPAPPSQPVEKARPLDRLFIPAWATSGGPPSIRLQEARRQLEASLTALRLADAAISRRIGEGLRLVRDGHIDPVKIGERSYRTFALNWLGISPTHASELACLSEALNRMPLLSAAYDTGRVSRSQAQILRKVIEPETEAAWIRLADGIAVRKLRKVVERHREETKGIPPEPETETVRMTLRGRPQDIHYAWTDGKEMVEKVVGHSVGRAAVMEALCAEWANEHLDLLPRVREAGGTNRWDEIRKRAKIEEFLPELPELPAPPEKDGGGETGKEDVSCPLEDLPDPSKVRGIEALLGVLRELMAIRQSLDWQAGRVLNLCRRLGVGFDPEEVLGVSRRWGAELRSLENRLMWLPRLREAYVTGRLGWAKTSLLLEICGPDTEAAWIVEARQVSLIFLDRQIATMKGMASLNRQHWYRRTRGLPPGETLLRELGILPGGHRHADWKALVRAANVRLAEGGEDRPVGRLGECVSAFRAPPDEVAFCWTVLMTVMRELRTMDEGKALRYLVDYFCRVYQAEHEALGGKHPTHERDAYVCRFPGCWKRVCEADHIKMKSRGGSDELWNRLCLCAVHHRIAKHLGLAKIWGTAPDDIYFQIGNRIWKDDRLIKVLGEGETFVQ